MHYANDFELWRQRHDDLMREREEGRIFRVLRTETANRNRNTTPGRAHGRVRNLLRIASEKGA